MGIFKEKRDNESFLRENTLDTMINNPYLVNGDIVLIAEDESFYTISATGSISLANGLKASKKTNNIISISEITTIINNNRR